MTRPDIRIILAAALLAMLVACSRQSESSMAAADMAASAPVVEETMPALPPPAYARPERVAAVSREAEDADLLGGLAGSALPVRSCSA